MAARRRMYVSCSSRGMAVFQLNEGERFYASLEREREREVVSVPSSPSHLFLPSLPLLGHPLSSKLLERKRKEKLTSATATRHAPPSRTPRPAARQAACSPSRWHRRTAQRPRLG